MLNRLVELNFNQIQPEINSERLDFVLQYNNEDIGHLVIRSISTNFNENNLEVLFIPILEKVASDYSIIDLTKKIALLDHNESGLFPGLLKDNQYWKMSKIVKKSKLVTKIDDLANIDELYLSQAPEVPMSFQEYYKMTKANMLQENNTRACISLVDIKFLNPF